jgi:hypothetical protein
VTGWLHKGETVPNVVAGLAYSIALNYLNRVVRGRKIGGVIYFQGGTAYNDAVAAAGGDLTRINNISFEVDSPSKYYSDARQKAMNDAATKAKQLLKEEDSDLIDMISVLNRGAMFPHPSLDSLETGKPFPTFEGVAAALGLLYNHLVSRATVFIERTIAWTHTLEIPATGLTMTSQQKAWRSPY